jgi:uncharacterized protein YcbK (DUF882 family)
VTKRPEPEGSAVGRALEEASDAVVHTVTEASEAILHTAEIVLRLPEPPRSRWHRAGVTPRGERIFNVIGGLVLALFAVGWTWSIAASRAGLGGSGSSGVITPVTASITAALTDADARSTAYLTAAVVQALVPLRGESGKLRARVQPAGAAIVADTLPDGTELHFSSDVAEQSVASASAPAAAGVWSLAVKAGSIIKPVTDLSVITLRPFTEKRRGRIGLYYIGSWPGEGTRSASRLDVPSGFIEVTQSNQDTPVSEHFTLRDFLTKGQETVWPKYLVLDMRLVDKLELVMLDLQERGHITNGVHVMSGFRTPQYNTGGGDPRGRASLSRHMYGDASDIFIDNDGNGWMDDLNRDGKLNIRDAEVVLAAVDRVEREHPTLVGGAGTYPATSGHGPFIHIDVRGYRARWSGTGE